ncbi:hypothetical protein P4I21_26935, partial [Escherichia coli]
MTCGNQADDPHHIIGHGLGGMGTKADDLFVIPLCRKCHNELHAGVKDFEVRIPLYSITDWHRSPISDSHPFDQP